jgi:hypothetical protein
LFSPDGSPEFGGFVHYEVSAVTEAAVAVKMLTGCASDMRV